MKSLIHKKGELTSYAYTTLEDVKARLSGSCYLPFKEGRAYTRSLGLKTKAAWISALSELPDYIPKAPPSVYKDEWVNWGDWLGSGHRPGFLPFKQARAIARKAGLSDTMDYKEWSKAKRPGNVPSNPQQTYRSEWVSWHDWLGTKKQVYRLFKKARAYARTTGVTTFYGWVAWSKAGNRPHDIPATPQAIYKGEWISWGDWLGTGYKRGAQLGNTHGIRNLVGKKRR